MNVFLAGEGRNELGGWAAGPEYRKTPPDPGVLESLLRRVEQDGWRIAGSICWKDIRKYQVGLIQGAGGDALNVFRAWFMAKERGCGALAFSRDRDGRKERQREIEKKIYELSATDGPRIIGGLAVEMIEGWILALMGRSRSEAKRHPEQEPELHGMTTEGMVAIVESADLDRLPEDAHSLKLWLRRAREVLSGADAAAS